MKDFMRDEEKLIRLAQKGDDKAYEVLVKRYDRAIFNLLLNILKNEDDASDAYQNTFIIVYNKLSTFNSNSSFYTWLYRIAYNCACEIYQKQKRVKETIYDADFSEIEEWYIGDNSDDNFEDERKVLVKNEINKLSLMQKTVVCLKCFEELKFEEIATIMKINAGTARSYFHRALTNLRKAINGENQNG